LIRKKLYFGQSIGKSNLSINKYFFFQKI